MNAAARIIMSLRFWHKPETRETVLTQTVRLDDSVLEIFSDGSTVLTNSNGTLRGRRGDDNSDTKHPGLRERR